MDAYGEILPGSWKMRDWIDVVGYKTPFVPSLETAVPLSAIGIIKIN